MQEVVRQQVHVHLITSCAPTKVLAVVFENISCGFVNLAYYYSLGGRGVIAKCKDDARQTRRYSTAGIVKTLRFSYTLFKTGSGAYLVLLCHGKEQFRYLLAVLYTAVWYVIYKSTVKLQSLPPLNVILTEPVL
jgi:hypothetical protein